MCVKLCRGNLVKLEFQSQNRVPSENVGGIGSVSELYD